jgi:hypothetical protein
MAVILVNQLIIVDEVNHGPRAILNICIIYPGIMNFELVFKLTKSSQIDLLEQQI